MAGSIISGDGCQSTKCGPYGAGVPTIESRMCLKKARAPSARCVGGDGLGNSVHNRVGGHCRVRVGA